MLAFTLNSGIIYRMIELEVGSIVKMSKKKFYDIFL